MRRSPNLFVCFLLCTACAAEPTPAAPRNTQTSGANAPERESASADPNPGPPEEPAAAEPEPVPPTNTQIVVSETDPVPARTQAPPQILILIAQMEEDLEAINAVRPLLMRIRSEVALPSQGAPLACRSDLRARVAEMIRRGIGPAGSSLSSARDAVDELCARFDRWENPDERWRSRIADYFAHLDHIDEWMTEIRRCIDPGPYNFPCENAYGPQEPGDAEQALAAMRVVREVRGVLVGVPESHPFPCYSPIWRRVEATTWTLSVARAQIPRLATSAESLCDSIGVNMDALNEKVRLIRDRVDRSNASLVQLGQSRQDALLRMRAMSFREATP